MINSIQKAIAATFFAAMIPGYVLAQSAYSVNFGEDEQPTHSSRYTRAIKLSSSDGNQTVQVNQKEENLLYIKRLNECFLAKAGETVTPTFDFNGSWMCGYAYIDFGKDGRYDVTYNDDSVTDMQDLMTYSLYKGKRSNNQSVNGNNDPGVNPPAFTIPAGTAPGIYRMRYKVDWDCVDPGGNTTTSNNLKKNGGVVVDTRINVHGETVNVNVASKGKGFITNADGTAYEGGKAEFGKDLVLNFKAEENVILGYVKIKHGYNLDGEEVVNDLRQWQYNSIFPSELSDNKVTIPREYVDGDLQIEAEFISIDEEQGGEYHLNFEETLKQSDPTANLLTEFSLTDAAGNKSAVTIPEGDTVYRNLLDQEISVKPGATLVPGMEYTGSNEMGAYLYIDRDQNGKFLAITGEDGALPPYSELVSYAGHNGKNSLGEASNGPKTMPSFTLPENLTAGKYRARLKIDRQNLNPAGDYDITNTLHIDNNNGYVVDFLLNVHNDKGRLEVNSLGGHIVGANNQGIGESVEYGKNLNLMAVAPADGYKVKQVKVRHGYNLNGEQFVHGNRQWEEYELTGVEAGSNFTVEAAKVNGDVRVTATFEADGTEEYKLVFADEFNGEDGSLPNAEAWHNCTRENPTWKRFTSQTAEGQQATAFISDGKLVTRAIKNNIAEEGDVDMISGAIESSDKVYFTYGRVEGRLRTTPHTGNFPAFWLMPQDNSAGWPNAGEIDIWEQIDTENKTYHTVHTHVTYDLHQALPNSGSVYTNAADYHVIALDWTPEKLTWYVDGQQAFTYAKSTKENLLNLGQWPYDKPFYIILNQSVGNGSWAKPCDVNFEYETLFDYVRVYQKNGMGDIVTNINATNAKPASLDVYPREGGVILVSTAEQTAEIYSISGSRVFAGKVQGNQFVALAKGVYIVNGNKIVVK